MAALIADNNRILEEVKANLEKKEGKFVEESNFIDASFSDVHNLIS